MPLPGGLALDRSNVVPRAQCPQVVHDRVQVIQGAPSTSLFFMLTVQDDTVQRSVFFALTVQDDTVQRSGIDKRGEKKEKKSGS